MWLEQCELRALKKGAVAGCSTRNGVCSLISEHISYNRCHISYKFDKSAKRQVN